MGLSDKTRTAHPYHRLNERQREVLLFLSKGLRNSEIAVQLRVSPRTVKACVSQLLLIYEASNRTELAGLASAGFEVGVPSAAGATSGGKYA